MNQGKMEVVKQKMARVNIDILGMRELKWTGMGMCLVTSVVSDSLRPDRLYSLAGSLDNEILQARILEWVSSQPKD